MSTLQSVTGTAQRGAGNQALRAWVERASSTQVPVFSTTVADVTSIADSRRSSAQDLAGAIGNDAALTAKLLKIANSPLFSQPGGHARSINNAVVLLGFDAVRDLAITIGIVDQARRSPDCAPLIDTLLRAFHCGAQARAIATATDALRPDEVFLAGLLSRLGELVFWASGTPEVEQLAEHWDGSGPSDEVQQQVLGFTLRDLTAELVHQWQLRGLLGCIMSARGNDERVAGVTLAHDISDLCNPQRWQTMKASTLSSDRASAALVARHAELLGQEVGDSLLQIQEEADKVSQIAKRFGVTSKVLQRQERAAQAEVQTDDEPGHSSAPTNAVRQVEILGRMSQMMQGSVTLDELVQLALEGIVDAAGFDRVCFALLTPDRQALTIKHRRGEFGELPQRLVLAENPQLESAIAQSGSLDFSEPWTMEGDPAWLAPQYSVLQPVFAGRTAIGLLYADREFSGPEVSEEAMAALVMFVHHVTLGLSVSGAA